VAQGGFFIDRASDAGQSGIENIQLAASTQYNVGDMCYMNAGVASQVAASSKGFYLFRAMLTQSYLLRPTTFNLSTTNGEIGEFEPVFGERVKLMSNIVSNAATPTIYNAPASANATANQVIVTIAGGTSGDYVGGQIFSNVLQQQRLITASTYGSGAYTFTVAPAFGQPTVLGYVNAYVTTGDTVTAVPISKGSTGIPFQAGSFPWQGIDCTKGASGGTNRIEGVNLQTLVVYSSCPNLF
jgi:hypothetical protein